MESLKIGVVIVTFNNAEMLRLVLGAILCQSIKFNEIIVIDNGSIDDTKDVVLKFSGIRYHKLFENTGSAGGFHEGIKFAAENNDYILTLDDDIVIEPNALETMKRYIVELASVTRLGAVRSWFVGQKPISKPQRIKDFAWRGTYISREAVIDVGLPNKEYFLYGEDTEYAYRISQKGWEMYIVPEHLMHDQRRKERLVVTVFGRERSVYKDEFRYYYSIRNQIHMYRTYKMWGRLIATLIYGIKVIILFCFTQGGKGCGFMKAIVDGIYDGLIARLGINIKYQPPQA